MGIVLYKLFIVMVTGIFWYGVAYQAYRHSMGMKGAKSYLAFYTFLCVLMVVVTMFAV